MKDYYELLEVSKNASDDTIKKVFRLLIKKNHPDLFEGAEKLKAEEKVKELNEAYEVVINKEKRKEYDLKLEEYNKKNEDALTVLMEENEYLKNVIKEKNQLIKEFFGEMDINDESYAGIYEDINSIENVDNVNMAESYNLYNKKQFIKKIISSAIIIVAGAIILWGVTGINLFKIFIDVFKTMF